MTRVESAAIIITSVLLAVGVVNWLFQEVWI